MKIKTKLQITTVVSLIVALVIGSILFFSAQQVNEAIKKDMATDEIIKGLFELNILTNEYLIHHEERAKTQWQLKHDSIKKLLEEVKVKSPEKMVLLKRMHGSHKDIKTVFSQMVLNYEGYRDEKSGVSQELNEMLVGNLDAKSRSMVSDAYQLAQISSARVSTSQQRAYFLVVLFTLIIAVVVATVSFSIHRGVVKPIKNLHEGTEIIGAGNLNYKVGTMAKDEVGQLSRAFDRMTIELKESFEGLEKEITERKRAEEEIRKLNRVYAVLSDINQAIVRIREPQELFETACRIVVEKGKFPLGWMGLVDDATQKIRPVASAGKSDGYLEEINISLKDKPRSYCPIDSALRERRPVVCNIIPHNVHMAPCKEIAFQLGFRSSASFPLIVSDKIRGTFNLFAGEPDFFDEEELKLLDELTLDISFAMEFAEKEAERKRAEEALQASYRFLQIAYSHTEIPSLLEEFVKEIKNYTGCDAVGIRILDEEGNIPYQTYKGFSRSFYELESPLSIKSEKCMCINVIKGDIDPKLPFYTEGGSFYMNGTTRFLATVSEEEKGQTRNVCNQVGYESVALVPIRMKDHILGLIHVADPREDMVPLKTVKVLEKAGMQLGTAILRRRAEEMLRESEERFRQFFENEPEYCYMVSSEGIILNVNTAVLEALGYAKADIVGKPLTTVYAPESLPKMQELLEKWRKTGNLRNEEMVIIGKNGVTRTVLLSASAVRDEGGKILHSVSVQRDITERKQAEEELKLSEHRYRNLFNTTRDVIFTLSKDGVLLSLNPMFEALTGWSRSEWVGKSFVPLVHHSDGPLALEMYRMALQGKTTPLFELRILTKQGEYIFGEFIVTTRFEGDQVVGVLGTVRDITERKKVEEEREKMQAQLIQAQKMESIGTLAGGVAHDFNNILTTIQGYAQLGLMSLKEGDPLYENLKEIQQASQRAANLTRQLLFFSRQQPMEVHSFSLNDTLNNLMKMLKRLIGEDISIHTELGPDLWTVTADPGNVEQVIMNLVVNAKDAMPEGGSIKIKTENAEIDKDYCDIHKYARPGRFVCLSIEDTGMGMDKGVVEHIFEPFFTTKGLGKGTGLGLSVVYGIVKQHEGWINVSSEPGKGSKFEVYLPASSGTAEEVIKKEVISGQDLKGKGERILLVEDDPKIREVANKVLARNGYEVLEASNTPEALDIFEKESGGLALVFSDVVLPDKSGLQLAEELLLRKPTLKVLLTSGYTDQKSQWPVIREKGYQFIQKPYGLTDLLRVVREVLDKRE